MQAALRAMGLSYFRLRGKSSSKSAGTGSGLPDDGAIQ